MRAGLKPAPTDGFSQQLQITHYPRGISPMDGFPNNYALRILNYRQNKEGVSRMEIHLIHPHILL